jgi:hypothetical protein
VRPVKKVDLRDQKKPGSVAGVFLMMPSAVREVNRVVLSISSTA